MDQFGRKSETTRVIASLQLKICTLARAGADQLDKPSMTADTGNGKRSRGQHRDPPARHSRSRLTEIGRLGLAPPAPERDTDRTGSFSRELKTPRRSHRETRDLADDGAQSAMAKTFLHAGEKRLVVTCLDVDHPVGRQPCLCECGRKKVWARDAPEHLAFRPRGDPASEERSGRAVDGAVSATRDLMQSTECKTSAGKPRIHLGNSERKHRFRAQGSALDLLDLRAQ